MKKERRRLYEGMYILSATLSEAARKKALDKILDSVTEKGGEINKIHEMGRKRLAYPIRKKQEGYYFLIYFTAASTVIPIIWQEYPLHEDLLRFMTMTAPCVLEDLEFKEPNKLRSNNDE